MFSLTYHIRQRYYNSQELYLQLNLLSSDHPCPLGHGAEAITTIFRFSSFFFPSLVFTWYFNLLYPVIIVEGARNLSPANLHSTRSKMHVLNTFEEKKAEFGVL